MTVVFRGALIHDKLVFKIAKSDPTQELLDRIREEIDFLNMSYPVHSLTLGTVRCIKWHDMLSDQFSSYSMTDNALQHQKRNRDHGLGKLSGTISKTVSTLTTT